MGFAAAEAAVNPRKYAAPVFQSAAHVVERPFEIQLNARRDLIIGQRAANSFLIGCAVDLVDEVDRLDIVGDLEELAERRGGHDRAAAVVGSARVYAGDHAERKKNRPG